jgi:hypothetical protein
VNGLLILGKTGVLLWAQSAGAASWRVGRSRRLMP